MPSPVLAAGLVVYRKSLEGVIEYLLLKASYPPYHWSPPKGHVDPGETELTTALRETEEEAGLQAKDLEIHDNFKEILKYEVRGKTKQVTYWLARLKSGKEVTLSKEHTDLVWSDCEKTIQLSGYADIAAVFRKCEEILADSK